MNLDEVLNKLSCSGRKRLESGAGLQAEINDL